MSMDDLSYLQALMGMTASEEAAGGATGGAGGVWVVDPEGVAAAAAYNVASSAVYVAADDAMLRLVGKARVVADALGGYVYLLACGSPAEDAAQRAIHAGADNVLTAAGTPALADLIEFFRERGPQLVLFPRTRRGRMLGPGLAQALGGGLCGNAADLAVDPMSQRVLAHQPVLDDAARQVVAIVAAPAVVVVDTAALPAAYNEPWRSGSVEDSGLAWPDAPEYPTIDLTGFANLSGLAALKNAPVVVAAGLGLVDEAGFALAGRLAEVLGGVVAGDTGALDLGWITEDQLVGLTGASVAPKLYLALGIDGDTSQFMATQEAGMIVAVQPDPAAPFVPVADYNIIADPAEFAGALLTELARV